MAVVKSERAKKLISKPVHAFSERTPSMRKYPDQQFELWVSLEREAKNVKKLSYYGTLKEDKQVLIEALAKLITGKPFATLDQTSFRECEAYLRDKNSEASLEELTTEDEEFFKKLLSWLRSFPFDLPSESYSFDFGRGVFSSLKLVDKVRELKAFLHSPEVLEIYQGNIRPELVDVDDLTVYVQAPYSSEQERAQFEELHLLGVSTFQEESLNFIPES